VALTFDDGPDPRGTPQVLQALEAMGVLATFFVTGEQVRDHPSVASDVVAACHEIAFGLPRLGYAADRGLRSFGPDLLNQR
jgi:hypothetical protein